MATAEKQGYFTRWTPKSEGIIAPDERLPWGQTILVGLQHVLAMFGATVLGPILMGFDPNTAIFFSFIGVVAAATGYAVGSGLPNTHISTALGGIIAAGLLYGIIGLIVMFVGYK